MSWWKFWDKKKVESPPQPQPQSSWLSFEIHPDANVTVYVEWPPPHSQEDIGRISQHLGVFLYLLTSGKMHNHIREAVIDGGKNGGHDAVISQGILENCDKVMDDKTIVVPPVKAFDPRQDGINPND